MGKNAYATLNQMVYLIRQDRQVEVINAKIQLKEI